MASTNPDSLTPRLPTSRQWTELPADFRQKVQKVFAEQFDIEAAHGEFLVEGRIYSEEMIVRIGYLERGRLRQINFEASIDLPKKDASESVQEDDSQSKAMERLYTCIDAIGSLMEEYFELGDDEEIDIPLQWRPYEFENETIYLQYSTVNTRLEDEADRLLGVGNRRLFNEEIEDEDALGKAEIDPELALAVQKAIREGKIPTIEAPEASDEANDLDSN